MTAFDFIMLTLIAFQSVCFHAALIANTKEVATGRIVLTLFFITLGAIAFYLKAGFS